MYDLSRFFLGIIVATIVISTLIIIVEYPHLIVRTIKKIFKKKKER